MPKTGGWNLNGWALCSSSKRAQAMCKRAVHLLLFTLSLLFLSLHLHPYFATTTTNVKSMFSTTLISYLKFEMRRQKQFNSSSSLYLSSFYPYTCTYPTIYGI